MIKKDKITIIGSGAFGTAMGFVLNDANKHVVIYGINQNELTELKKGQNLKYFPNSVLLPKFKTSNNLKKAINNSKYILLAIPSQNINKIFEKILKILNNSVVIINGSKGFYPNTNLLLHSGLLKASKNNKFIKGIVSISGPSHAEEIVLRYPTIVAIVGNDIKINKKIYKMFKTKYFKTYIQNDIIGVEVGAAYKNILAIASGISTSLGFHFNTRAAIISRGLSEMSRFNKFMHGKHETIYGLTGLGDLIVTATSNLSRNFQYGKELVNLQDRKQSKFTVEGLIALKYVYKIAIKKKLHLPIVYCLYNIIFKNNDISKEINKIWNNNKIFE